MIKTGLTGVGKTTPLEDKMNRFRLFDVKYGWDAFKGDPAVEERHVVEVDMIYGLTEAESICHTLEKLGDYPDWIEIMKDDRSEKFNIDYDRVPGDRVKEAAYEAAE